ncbi:MAG: hypothetical protein R3308_00445 [Thiohalobacterales bacterium]|nr:hypothetical protein [Thiohalobacterales bacterium]
MLNPYIIDLEASGLASNSYPIEVGLALAPGQRFCALIKPADGWEHWDREAESVHGISRDVLLHKGRPASEIAAELNRLLGNKIVYSDAWSFDSAWVTTLFAAARMDMTFNIHALEMIMNEQQIAIWVETRDSVANDLGLERHRASNDAWIIQETYARTLAMSSSATT